MVNQTTDSLTERYDSAAPLWTDKMRLLGYYDAYLGMLSNWPDEGGRGRVMDIGAGTAAMAEAWVAVHGAPESLTLLDPSRKMLDHGAARLARRHVSARLVAGRLEDAPSEQYDTLLAAHVIEHMDVPDIALGRMAALLRPGGRLWLVVSKPHWCNAIIWLQWRHRTYSEATIGELLDRAGFDLLDTYGFPSGPPSRTSRGYLVARR